jgi:hypothetical protein
MANQSSGPAPSNVANVQNAELRQQSLRRGPTDPGAADRAAATQHDDAQFNNIVTVLNYARGYA